MRWGSFWLALLLALLLQAGLLWTFGLRWLDPLLVVALLAGLSANTSDARIAGWLCGLACDLGSADPLGLNAFLFGAAAWLLTDLRGRLNLQVPWTRLLAAFIAAWPTQCLAHAYRAHWIAAAPTPWTEWLWQGAATAAACAFCAFLLTLLPVWLRLRRRGAWEMSAAAQR